MINEIFLFIHIIAISITALICLRMGKESLVAFVAVQMIIANLFVLKQTTLFGLNATCADAYAVGAMLGLNLLQEFYSSRLAHTTIYITFLLSFFFMIVSQIHLAYVPAIFDTMHQYFEPILSFVPKLVFASMIVYLISQTLDVLLYATFQRIWQYRFIVIRNWLAIGISQFVDTILFSAFLWWLNIITNFTQIVLISFTIKFIITLISTPMVALAARTFKKET